VVVVIGMPVLIAVVVFMLTNAHLRLQPNRPIPLQVERWVLVNG
jgi:hypothetical protein